MYWGRDKSINVLRLKRRKHQLNGWNNNKEEAIKDIGGEDAFNQEYGLRFVNSGRSLLSESIIDELLKIRKTIYTQNFRIRE
jgi:hypothetical protein